MLFNKNVVHLEVSSKCTLKCPRCPRTEFKLGELNQEITLEEFISAFTTQTLNGIEKIIFCGDIGDPIYAKDFLDICNYIKSSSNTTISIITNGSYKTVNWWQQLGNILNKHDRVTFSVDGWDQESNNIYRINNDFNSIVAGAQALRSSSNCQMNWSTIYFNFNEEQINLIQNKAMSLGFDTFQTVKSSKFDGRYSINGVDPLKPMNVANTLQYERHTTVLNRAPTVPVDLRRKYHPWAKCVNWEKEIFISVTGLVFPCPWFNNGYQQNEFVKKYQNRLSIKLRSLDEVLQDNVWQELVDSFDHNPLEICNLKCKNGQQ